MFTPSYYPQEITIATVDPAAAGAQLQKTTLHAYVGATPRLPAGAGAELKAVESLEAFLVLGFNPATKAFAQPAQRCAAARGILAGLDPEHPEIMLSPYPVTPFHPDYLRHLDRVDAAAAARAGAKVERDVAFRARGARAQALAQSRWRLGAADAWDASLEEVPVAALMPPAASGWPGPPWMKEGWFHAYRLLGAAVSDPADRRSADAAYRRLAHGEYAGPTEQARLQRDLLASLLRGCDRVVLGYTVRREYYNDGYAGIENVAVDAQLGLNTPVFLRTVKLKDFPWNGWLYLGTEDRPAAAWNPVAGFTDVPGRLLWSAVGDAAELPMPYNASWIPNRAQAETEVALQSPGIRVPPDALLPRAGAGELAPVGAGKFAAARVRYRVSASRFHDGTRTEVADLLYPYVFAYRWSEKAGAKAPGDGRAYDPAVDAGTAWMRERLKGLKVLRVEKRINDIADDIKVPVEFPVVDVYVDYAAPDLPQVAALAPPWSTVPWHVLVLMEEAVQRGWAAFSQEEAGRRAVSWLDLVRDGPLLARLRALIAQFEQEGYRPAALQGRVTAEAARDRWRALAAFAAEHGHLLVTNGPYRLTQWTDASAVVQVNRELTYPHSVGSFNHYADPPRAVITAVRQEAGRVLVDVDVEKLVQEQRRYRTVREPLKRQSLRGLYRIRPDARYVVLGPDGAVVATGAATLREDGRFAAELPQRLPRARYTFMIGIFLDGNAVRPATRVLSFDAGAS